MLIKSHGSNDNPHFFSPIQSGEPVKVVLVILVYSIQHLPLHKISFCVAFSDEWRIAVQHADHGFESLMLSGILFSLETKCWSFNYMA